MGGEGRGRSGRLGEGGEYDQNTFYGILKELIQIFKNIE